MFQCIFHYFHIAVRCYFLFQPKIKGYFVKLFTLGFFFGGVVYLNAILNNGGSQLFLDIVGLAFFFFLEIMFSSFIAFLIFSHCFFHYIYKLKSEGRSWLNRFYFLESLQCCYLNLTLYWQLLNNYSLNVYFHLKTPIKS